MLIVYNSRTGNVQRFVNKLGDESVKITNGLLLYRPFVLITYTESFGAVPESTQDFLKDNYINMVGVAASGNRNWGTNFGKAGDIISDSYKVPLLLKFELSGTQGDVDKFRKRLTELCDTSN